MSIACPNRTSLEWLTLVEALGEAKAMSAFTLNGDSIPDVTTAEKLIEGAQSELPDDRFNAATVHFKLKRIYDQRINVKNALTSNITPQQKTTLQSLDLMLDNYQKHLIAEQEAKDSNIPFQSTHSVTSYIGGSEFTGDPSKYENFKLFGIFIHGVLEEAQISSAKNKKILSNTLTREFFDKNLEDFKQKNPFVIKDLTEDIMFEMTKQLSENISFLSNSNYIILPEITVFGKTRTDASLVGRLDLVAIDPNGVAKVLDFKTKKVKTLISVDTTGVQSEPNIQSARNELATNSYRITKTDKTPNDIIKDSALRNSYETWALQLKIYENLLAQNNIPIAENAIIALLYQTKIDQTFQGYALQVFEGGNYLSGITGQTKKKLASTERSLAKLRNTIDVLILNKRIW